ncbi:MAG TPA: hypothetical protein VGM17_07125 [Rhizomicrobium sp.]|jgi:cobalamin biosynthesis Mg chelatase CobN
MDRVETPHEIHSPDGSGNEVTTTEARQGVTGTGTRYVLWIGMALVVVAFLIIYFVMARSW